MSGSEGRESILKLVRSAVAHRECPDLPAPRSPLPLSAEEGIDLFARRFIQNGGEVVRFLSAHRARTWLEGIGQEFPTVAVGSGVPILLAPALPAAPPAEAHLGVSLARAAVAETGSLCLDSREGRLSQLLPPCHLIWVREADVVGSLEEALAKLRGDLPSALALHSGPSRSADIGQIMVQGVHGPGRVIAGIVP